MWQLIYGSGFYKYDRYSELILAKLSAVVKVVRCLKRGDEKKRREEIILSKLHIAEEKGLEK